MPWWVGAACREAGGPAAHVDHTLLSLVDSRGLDADLVCTHVDRTGVVATVTMSARLCRAPAPADLTALAATVLSGPRPDGRCIRFPGQSGLTGLVSAGDIVATSAIDEVVGIGTTVTADRLVDTLDFLRPTFTDGRLVLLVEPAAGGVLRPAEIKDPHQCCGGH